MKTLGVMAAVVLVGVGVLVGYFAAQGHVSAASDELTAQDYADIQQLYWRYNHGADFGDADLFVSAFTDDAFVKSSNGQEYVGKEEINEFISGSLAQMPSGDTGRRHWNNGWRITPSPDGARGRTYWLLIDVGTGQPTNDRSGYYEDVYVKTSEGWRIKSRMILGDDR